jgi:hypothetical protein
MRVVNVKPNVNALLSGELRFADTNEATVRVLLARFTATLVQSDFIERLLKAAPQDKRLLQRLQELAQHEVLINIDAVEVDGAALRVKYTAYPGNGLPPLG